MALQPGRALHAEPARGSEPARGQVSARGADGWAVAPLEPQLAEELRRLIARLNPGQRLWLSGYLAGASESAAPAAAPAAPASPQQPVLVLYGSQSGNSQRLAGEIGEALTRRGLPFTLLDMMDCRKSHLQEARRLLMVVSTHGEGVPPDRALPLHELLQSRKAPQLGHLEYAVLALGDSSYEMFCETGRQFDARLRELGAQALHARVECDVDFEAPAREWIAAVLDKLAQAEAGASAEVSAHVVAAGERPLASVATAWTRKNPLAAPVLVNQRLTAHDSTKDVRHIELSLEGSGIRYEPGDALGVVPRNHAADVEALLGALRYDAGTPVTVDAQSASLRDALRDRYDIGLLSRGLLERYARATGTSALEALLAEERKDDLQRYLRGRHLIDLVSEHPPRGLDAAGFATLLRPLAPRLYSIASSQRATPDEVHLTVSLVAYDSLGRGRRGVVSGFLANLDTEPGSTAPVYLHRNPNFRLPADPESPLIMIGPGTGVAPFRGFLAEREALGARGRNWLFFGDRSFRSDFLYQLEWLDWRKRGLLTRIDVAFSRDQTEKLYVQQRILEQGAQLWRWIEEGAHLYVCGDAQRMAPDVHGALLEVARRYGGRSAEQAGEYLLELQRERRYQRDVY